MKTPTETEPCRCGGPLARRKQILLVDDSVELAQLMEFGLRAAGFDITLRHTGLQAQAHLRNEPVDLAILDVDLPDLSGFDVCEWMRADERLQSVPVIICTGRSATSDVARARLLGANAFIQKPFRLSELVEAVREALSPTGLPHNQER